MKVSFPGGKKVDVHFKSFTVNTDQRREDGTDGSAPEPFDLFLASIAACAGVYALSFCQQREISTDGLSLELETRRDPEKRMISNVTIKLTLPPGFPPKYTSAIAHAVEHCAVKKHILDAPEFETQVTNAADGKSP